MTAPVLQERFVKLLEARISRLTIRGNKAKGLCPFHPDHTPSFTADLEKCVWYCFPCARGGGVKDFALAVGEKLPLVRHKAHASVHDLALQRTKKVFAEWCEKKHRALCRERRVLEIDRDIAVIAYQQAYHRPDLYSDEDATFWSRTLGSLYDRIAIIDNDLELLVLHGEQSTLVRWWMAEEGE